MIIDNLSVECCTNNTSKNAKNQMVININSPDIEKIAAKEIKTAVKALKKLQGICYY